METTEMTDFTAIREAEKKATKGPWAVEDPLDFALSIVEANKETYEWKFIATVPLPDDEPSDNEFSLAVCEANAAFIALSRAAVPALLAEVDRLAAENKRMREAISSLEPMLDFMDPDCLEPDCPDCGPWRPLRAAIKTTAKYTMMWQSLNAERTLRALRKDTP